MTKAHIIVVEDDPSILFMVKMTLEYSGYRVTTATDGTAASAILGRTRPDLPRAFRTPLVPLVAGLSVLMCLYLMLNLTGETWERFGIWMAIGFLVYFIYGRRHSRLGKEEPAADPSPAPR